MKKIFFVVMAAMMVLTLSCKKGSMQKPGCFAFS